MHRLFRSSTGRWTPQAHHPALSSSQPEAIQLAPQPAERLHHGIASFARQPEELAQTEMMLIAEFPGWGETKNPRRPFDYFQIAHDSQFTGQNFPTATHSARDAAGLQKQPRTNQIKAG